MARKPVLEGGKKDELVAAALKLFMENGYEQTSVRSILDAVGGEVGMFYHYFKSKDEVFEAAVELYLKQYVGQINAAANTNSGISEQYRCFMDLAGHAIMSYNRLGGQNLHWSTASALHQRTLLAMLTLSCYSCKVITQYTKIGLLCEAFERFDIRFINRILR